MRIYRFSIHNSRRRAREDTGRMPLSDDHSAGAFAEAMVRDITRDGVGPYVGWTMEVAQGRRAVCSVPFRSVNKRAR